MVPIVNQTSGNWLTPLLAGLVYAMTVAGTATIVLSLLLAITGLKEQSLPLYVFVIHGLSVMIGGFIAARRTGAKGWYRGGMLGLVYGLIVSLVSWLGFDAALGSSSLIFMAASFAVGALGGMMGINTRK